MQRETRRRQFIRDLGLGAASLPYLLNLPSLAHAGSAERKRRLIIIFSPDGIVPDTFWPDEEGPNFTFKESLKPLEPFRDRTLILHGLCDKLKGDGDNHMRGMGCLLTGSELYPGNIQGGSDTPAGWASGISIDQEIKTRLQQDPATKTRFGSLEFGVLVPDRADTWTRMVYAGPNKPIAPIDDPYQMFAKLYGKKKDGENLASVLDELQSDLQKVASNLGPEDRRLLDEHTTFVREMELDLKQAKESDLDHPVPEIESGIKRENENMPRITTMQMDLLVQSLAADFARVSTFQFTNSVGEAKMRWLGISEGQHALSHEPDSNKEAQEKLTKINRWYCEQIAYLVQRLADTVDPDGSGSLLDNTTIVWTNELGKGNSHTLDNIPFVLVGNGLGFRMGRSVRYKRVPHNRFLMSLAHGMGHTISKFGNPDFCGDGPLADLS